MAVANIYRVVQDLEGNVVTGVLGTVTLTGTSTLAALFSDSAGTLALPNPTTNNAQYGSFNLFVAAGSYDMQFVKSGYTFETQRNIVLRDPASGVNTITGTANRVLVSPASGFGAVTLSTPQDIAPDSSVQFAHVGLGTPATGYVLTVVGESTMGATTLERLGVGIAPPITVGDAQVGSRLGVGAAIEASYSLAVGFGARVAGATSLDRLGVGVLVPATTGDVSMVRLGIGMPPDPLYSLTVQYQSVFVGPVWGQGGFTVTANILGDNAIGLFTNVADAGGTNRWNINAAGTAPNNFTGRVGIGGQNASGQLAVRYPKAGLNGMIIQPTDADTGQAAVLFVTVAASTVGSITTNASTTAYNTTSDARLKHDVTALTGELALIQALRPVRFRWNADDSEGVGFLAHEVAAHVQGVISGEPDAVDEAGAIIPQQIDASKLVPWLVGAVQTLVQRLEVVEDAAGV